MAFDLLRPTLPALVRRAQAVLEERTGSAANLPAVIWQGIGEGTEAFTARVVKARARVPPGLRVLAVVAGIAPEQLEGLTWVELPVALHELLHPERPARTRTAYGGRGSGKSFAFATGLLLRAITKRVRILCCREIQRSIRESILQTLAERIEVLGLSAFFEIRESGISCSNGSEFIFEGLFGNVTKIKSLQGVTFCFIDEAERVSQKSLETLLPTIREKNSELWFALNPDLATDPIYERFVTSAPPKSLRAHVNYDANPWFPDVLELERSYLQSVDADAYSNVWLGLPRTASDAQIFKGKYFVEEFTAGAGWSGPYLGADFGFAQDPTTLVKLWVHEKKLFVEYEAWAIGCDIDRTPMLFDAVPDARRHPIRADCARPETISYLQRNGYGTVRGVEKWKGSVEDGIAFMRSFERIVIHPRCTYAAQEFQRYSYKVDRLTGDIRPEPEDRWNHIIDACRYALVPMYRQQGMGFYYWLERKANELTEGGGAHP